MNNKKSFAVVCLVTIFALLAEAGNWGRPSSARCQASRSDGSPCRHPVVNGTNYCRRHQNAASAATAVTTNATASASAAVATATNAAAMATSSGELSVTNAEASVSKAVTSVQTLTSSQTWSANNWTNAAKNASDAWTNTRKAIDDVKSLFGGKK